MPLSVPDLACFLSGRWHICRRIIDQRSGVTGRFMGTAIFTPAPGGLRYDEWGILIYGLFREEAGQTYQFAIGPHSGVAEVHFADGRHFHTCDLLFGLAHVAHECAPDRYWGRYRVSSHGEWTLVWKVAGPRKRMLIATRYAREVPMP
jgi:Family of unknown function (DUF6314)